jgi:hypothetical protein
MAIFSPLGAGALHRHPLQKRRRPGAFQRHLPFVAVATVVVLLYAYMLPDQLYARLFGGAAATHLNEDRVLTS